MTPSASRPRSARRGLAVVVAVLVSPVGLAACGLPTPPGVRVDRPVGDDSAVGDDAPEIRKLPPGPVAGQSPEQVVQGFLDAVGASTDDGHALARSFLVPGTSWDDRASRTVYDATTLATTVAGTTSAQTVQLRAQELARIDADGGLRPSGAPLRLGLRLSRTSEGWRIRSLPAGSWLTPRDLSRGYTSAVVWTGGRDGAPLQPETVAVPGERAALPGAVMRMLLTRLQAERSLPTGPSPNGGAGPPVGLVGSVLLDGRRAVVDLSRAVYSLDDAARERLLVQTAATLGSLPSVDEVRVLGDGRLLPGGDRPATDPAGPVVPGPGAAVRDGRAVAVAVGPTDGAVLVGGPLGGRPTGPVQAAVPGADGRLALLPPPGATGPAAMLVVRRPGSGDQQVAPSAAGPAGTSGRWASATWLPDGSLLAALDGTRPGLVLVRPDGSPARVGALPPAAGPVKSLSADPSGTTVAAVAGAPGQGAVWLARLDAGPSLPAPAWLPVPAAVTGATATAWTDPLGLVVAGTGRARPDAAPAVPGPVLEVLRLMTPTTTTATATGGLPAPVDGVAAAPDRPLVVSAAGSLWQQGGSGWLRIGPGRAPAWP